MVVDLVVLSVMNLLVDLLRGVTPLDFVAVLHLLSAALAGADLEDARFDDWPPFISDCGSGHDGTNCAKSGWWCI